jgi:hypothetical protein
VKGVKGTNYAYGCACMGGLCSLKPTCWCIFPIECLPALLDDEKWDHCRRFINFWMMKSWKTAASYKILQLCVLGLCAEVRGSHCWLVDVCAGVCESLLGG